MQINIDEIYLSQTNSLVYVDCYIVYLEYLTSKLDYLGYINNGGEESNDESNDDEMYILGLIYIYTYH